MKSPLALVKERFTDKAGLVSALKDLANDDLWVSRLNDGQGWEGISNSKLLRLHEVLSAVKKEYGTRGKMIDAIMAAGKRKDEGYKTKLEKLSTPRLYDMAKVAKKKS
jgi:hypothetical protein